MHIKTIGFSFVAGMLLAVAKPAISGVPEEVKVNFAKAVYSGSPQWVHKRNPQPLLRAVIVLNVKLGDGDRWCVEVLRTNDEQPEMLALAIETVQRAGEIPLSEETKAELRRNGLIEAWLFDNDGSFQVKTLAKAQRTGQ